MQTTILYEELKRISEWIKFADTKAAFIWSIYLAASSWLYSIKEGLSENYSFFTSFTFYSTLIIISLWFTLVMLSVLPRRKNGLTKISLLYYESVAIMEPDKFRDQLLTINEGDFQIHIMEQIYTNSKIATRKMKYIELSILNLAILLFLGILLIIVK